MDHSSLLKSSFNYIRHAVERRTQPEHFIVADKTRHDVVYRDGLMELRYYPHQDDRPFTIDGDAVTPQQHQHAVPIILVPPRGVFHWIYDLVNWGAPGERDANLSFDTYVNRWLTAAVEQVQQHSGQHDVSMVGYCMGGLLTLLYAGAHDQGQIRNIVTIASPVDFHATHGGPALRLIDKGMSALPLRHIHIDAEKFHVPGDVLSVAFKLTNPFAGVVSYFDLVRNLADRDYVKAHLTTREWFNNMPDYPGATVQQLLFDLCIHNKLNRGRMQIGDCESDLTGINSNLLAFAGKSDRIVTIRAARRLMELVGSKDKTFKVVPGGHAGVFAGGKAQDHTWVVTADWLAQRSD